ncbi:hypothetical protein B6D16_12915 [Gilliamella apicola]|uniref:hypothetical protein n=1 Tax=Gilliamella TaxID=1193503 RepID=UPI0008105F29|nr:hypothetical protein [Gilliamella apicola]OCF92564.1 hypothetical protein A9G17_05245 [Gilliamella apicola]OTP92051.1 hypothetical protein B6D05_13070 [Gilliamella apicola]OTQ13272.1 hypothetical protein B6D16_12915 [Gilliamella apicola]OTQ26246.1 hypothetical protein B6D04_00150 [Gilliamella apicola]
MANISLDAVDSINSKLDQANAITTLLMSECDKDTKLSDELRSYVLWAISDLITDSKKLFSSETESKGRK